MNLELVSRKPLGRARPTPLLFVHGAYGAAWVWDQHFLPFFAERGYEAHALSLRGHGASDGVDRLPFTRMRDYVADLDQVVRSLPALPVLIGHSMGGLVVQHYLHRESVPAAVLMASVPPHGMIGSFFGIAFTNPTLFRELATVQTFGPAAANGVGVRRALFSDDTPESVISKVLPRLQSESLLVIFDLMGLDLPPSLPLLDLPVLVLGAEKDAFVFPGAVEATARTYRTNPVMFPGVAHAMMLEPGWDRVAALVADWLDATLPGVADPQAAASTAKVAETKAPAEAPVDSADVPVTPSTEAA
jgi:pimeloyl-ACP methyl ester carboxylesterase